MSKRSETAYIQGTKKNSHRTHEALEQFTIRMKRKHKIIYVSIVQDKSMVEDTTLWDKESFKEMIHELLRQEKGK